MKTFQQFIEASLRPGETYGSSSFQDRLEKERTRDKEKKAAEQEKNRARIAKQRREGRGISGYFKNPSTGRVEKGRQITDQFGNKTIIWDN